MKADKNHLELCQSMRSVAEDHMQPNEVSEEILALIRKEDDTKSKTTLLILYKLATSLDENTSIVKKMVTDFEAHRGAIDETVQQRKGAKKVLIPLISAMQGLILLGLGFVYNSYTKEVDKTNNLESRVSVAESKLDTYGVLFDNLEVNNGHSSHR